MKLFKSILLLYYESIACYLVEGKICFFSADGGGYRLVLTGEQ